MQGRVMKVWKRESSIFSEQESGDDLVSGLDLVFGLQALSVETSLGPVL